MAIWQSKLVAVRERIVPNQGGCDMIYPCNKISFYKILKLPVEQLSTKFLITPSVYAWNPLSYKMASCHNKISQGLSYIESEYKKTNDITLQ